MIPHTSFISELIIFLAVGVFLKKSITTMTSVQVCCYTLNANMRVYVFDNFIKSVIAFDIVFTYP